MIHPKLSRKSVLLPLLYTVRTLCGFESIFPTAKKQNKRKNLVVWLHVHISNQQFGIHLFEY
jgi:hypothetical protein